MTLQDLSNISTIVAAISLVISAWLVFHEFRANNKLIRAGNTQSLVNLATPFWMCMVQERKCAEFYLKGAREIDGMDEVDRFRYESLLNWWLIFHENIYYQWRRGLLDDHSYQPWSMDLSLFIERQNLVSRWETMKGLFQEQFAQHVSKSIAEQRKS